MFSDRLVGAKDHETFVSALSDKLGTLFDLTYHNLCSNKQPPIFGTQMVFVAIEGGWWVSREWVDDTCISLK